MGIQGAVQSQNLLLVLASMIIGTLVGTAIGIEDGMNRFGEFLKKRMGHGDDSRFVRGFVTLSIMQVIGAMAMIMYELFSLVETRTTAWAHRGANNH